MKTIIKISCIALFSISCKAQTVNITEMDGERVTGAYYKDIDHLLDPFEGTYVYVNGNDTLKFVFQKMEASNMNGYYQEDLLVGEYRYVKNGVERANTLPRFDEGITNGRKFSVSSNLLVSGYNYSCPDCLPTEKLLNTGLSDCLSDRTAYFTVRRKTVSGQPAIQISIAWRSDGFGRNRTAFEPAPPQPALPNGEFILLKE